MDKFTCRCCQGIFDVEQSEVEVLLDVVIESEEDVAIVCDACYQEIINFEASIA